MGLVGMLVAMFAAASMLPAQTVTAPGSFTEIFGKSGATFLGRSASPTRDGGYVLAGVATTTSNNIVILKLNAAGQVSWQNIYTVAGVESDGYRVRQTSSGYIVVATLGPVGGPSVPMVMALDAAGAVVWQKAYPAGGPIGALPLSIEEAPGGGYLLGAINFNTGSGLWGVKLDASGNIVWQKVLGVLPGTIHVTADGGAVASGYTFCAPECQPHIIKLDSAGIPQWDRIYAFGSGGSFGAARQTSDGGYVAAGAFGTGTGSNNAALLMKLDAHGAVSWLTGYQSGLCASAGAVDVMPSPGGGYLLTLGGVCSGEGALKVDGNGAIEWQQILGYSANIVLLTDWIQPARDGGYILTGSLGSLTFPPRLLALKVDASGGTSSCIQVSSPGLAAVTPPSPTIMPGRGSSTTTTTVPGFVAVTATPAALAANGACRPKTPGFTPEAAKFATEARARMIL